MYSTILIQYIFQKQSIDFLYKNRLVQSESKSKLEPTEKNFMNRATLSYNQIPTILRQIPKIEEFKKKMKVWVLTNI